MNAVMDMDELFLRAVEVVLEHEGGYVNDPHDPGGETKYGISKLSYPHLDIANLTREQAIEIYRRDWWDTYGYWRFASPDIAIKVFDLSVNVGPRRAHVMLQRALHAVGRRDVVVDGIIGPQTISAANAAPPDALLAALRAEAAAYYRQLIERNPTLKKYERGWMRRAYA